MVKYWVFLGIDGLGFAVPRKAVTLQRNYKIKQCSTMHITCERTDGIIIIKREGLVHLKAVFELPGVLKGGLNLLTGFSTPLTHSNYVLGVSYILYT